MLHFRNYSPPPVSRIFKALSENAILRLKPLPQLQLPASSAPLFRKKPCTHALCIAFVSQRKSQVYPSLLNRKWRTWGLSQSRTGQKETFNRADSRGRSSRAAPHKENLTVSALGAGGQSLKVSELGCAPPLQAGICRLVSILPNPQKYPTMENTPPHPHPCLEYLLIFGFGLVFWLFIEALMYKINIFKEHEKVSMET